MNGIVIGDVQGEIQEKRRQRQKQYRPEMLVNAQAEQGKCGHLEYRKDPQ
jgi:hypothetical protein